MLKYRRHGRRAQRELHRGPAALGDVAVVERPVAVPRLPRAVRRHHLQRRLLIPRPQRRGHRGRAPRELRPHDARRAADVAEQTEAVPGLGVEHNRTVRSPRPELPAPILVAVRQHEPEGPARPEVHGVESREAPSRNDAVVGGVAQPVLESHADLRRRTIYDLAVLVSETVAVVVGVRAHGSRLVLGQGRGALHDVAQHVVRSVGRRIHPSGRIGRGRRRGQTHGPESHPPFERRRIAPGISSAHVERFERRRLHEVAPHGIPRRREERPHERRDMQKGVVVVGREHPQHRLQVRRSVPLRVTVAHHREELHRARVAPPRPYVLRVEITVEFERYVAKPPERRTPRPAGRSAAYVDPKALVRHREQAHRPFVQRRAVVRQPRLVARGVECRPAGEKEFVPLGAGQHDGHPVPLAQPLGRAQPLRIVPRIERRARLQVADRSVYAQSHTSSYSS